MKKLIKHYMIKSLNVITIITLFAYLIINVVIQSNVYGAQYKEEYSSKTANYPGYKALIDAMKAAHPNWKFTIFYTGLDWNQVIKNETTAYHGRNLVPSNSTSSWICPVCGSKSYDTGWRCASEAAVSYFMDPRNWINDSYIFQFENLSYNENIQTLQGVQKITSQIGYMSGNTITYTKTDGTKGTINKSYAQVILEAAKEAGISPYHLASRIKQEQGADSTPGSTATGTYAGYVGYYNFMNIGASGQGTTAVIVNGLNKAKQNGWTDPEISIKEGAKILASNYINNGQNTLYLQKFDVDDNGSLYYHQYMQNVYAAKNESINMKAAYEQLGFLGNSMEFIIPVYENMPSTICPEPAETNIVTQNVKINGTGVNVRIGPGKSYNSITTLNTGTVLLRIELATKVIDNNYWDKVVLSDGTKGYVSRTYLTSIPDVTNCNETVIMTGNDVCLRNGPGTTGTTVITTLTKGQILTRIQKSAYQVDGYVWDRVKLSDGRQGYIAQKYVQIYESNTSTGGETSSIQLIRIICNSGVRIRRAPGTSADILGSLSKGETATKTSTEGVSKDGFIWDKIVTTSGIEGYIARGDSTENYYEVIGTQTPTPTPTPEPEIDISKYNNFKLENTQITCEPATTVENIKQKYEDVVIKNANGETITSGNIGTGYIVEVGGNIYVAIKIGDVNGDGIITSSDYVRIKNKLRGVESLTEYEIIASDATGDGKVTSADYVKVKNVLRKKESIQLQ